MGFLKDLSNYLGSSDHLKKIWIKKYYKLYGKSISNGYSSNDAHLECLARLLVAQSKLSNYHVNRSKLIAEIFPFGLIKTDERIALFFEYILFLQDNSDMNFSLLKNGVNNIVSESLTETHANNYSEIIAEAIHYDIAWTRFLTNENREKINDFKKNPHQQDLNDEVELKLTTEDVKIIENEEDPEIDRDLRLKFHRLKSRAGIFRHASSDLKEQIIKEFLNFTEDDETIRQISNEVYHEIVSRRQRGKSNI